MSAPPIRVLLVDDSSVVRRLLTQALAQHPEVTVAGTAGNGLLALNKLSQINPDVVILDVEMPEMDGITTLGHLRQAYPRLPVIMFSTLTERGASTTFDALAAGASDYVLKPSTSTGETLEHVVANSLVPKIVALTRSRFGFALASAIASSQDSVVKAPRPGPAVIPGAPTPSAAAGPLTRSTFNAPITKSMTAPQVSNVGKPTLASPARTEQTGLSALLSPKAFPETVTTSTGIITPANKKASVLTAQKPSMPSLWPRKPVQIIAIASSTGGPNALAEVLPRLPAGLPVPIVVVQHMPPIFTRCLADRLGSRSELKVRESEGRERLQPGHVYIAPGNHHLEVVREGDAVFTNLTEAPPENSCRPAADVLFRSVARVYGQSALLVVLTGMGHDGLRGAREVHDAGGRILVQSGPTCVIWGMPKAVEEAGLAEAVVPLSEMSAAILTRVGSGLLASLSPEKGR